MSIRNQKHLLSFAMKHPLTWHSFAGDKETVEAVCGLHNLGIIEVNEHNQFSLKSETKAKQWLGSLENV